MNAIETLFYRLGQSKFRSRFHLSKKEIDYIKKQGWYKIESHARDFIRTRLAPQTISNDGKQTPMKGHPVFIAQHATATCCRNCLMKWYHIPKNKELTKQEQEKIVLILMTWIKREFQKSNDK